MNFGPEIMDLRSQGLKDYQIQKILGCSRETVRNHHGSKNPRQRYVHGRNLSEGEKNTIFQLKSQGRSVMEIEEYLVLDGERYGIIYPRSGESPG